MSAKRLGAAALVILCAASGGTALAQTGVSINSTVQSRATVPPAFVKPPPLAGDGAHRVLVANDLGMHCADLDARIASILPPFNVLHAQVLATGAKPVLMSKANASVFYSASSNPLDPALANPPVLSATGAPFKSNAGSALVATYAPLYPPGLLGTFFPAAATRKGDLGLPVPDVAQLYLGNGTVQFHQATMPSVTSSAFDPATGVPTTFLSKPYSANVPQPFRVFDTNWPLFSTLPFGYVANTVNWFAAEGIPAAPFDDGGRENPFSLMRVQAKNPATGAVLASLDAVVPVSGETNCKGCHLAAPDGNGLGTKRLAKPIAPSADPAFGKLIAYVSQEWAADINIVRLHDQMHGTKLYSGYSAASGAAAKPVLCQTCHYSPALDLTQSGPKSGNGLEQAQHETMSRVMHFTHGNLQVNGAPLFPMMPPANDPRRSAAPGGGPDNGFTEGLLQQTCYQCHPGQRTKCLRGTMFSNAGSICQDCHGQMTQIGDDFSRKQPGGGFQVAADFYTNPATPRVPWANEPTCGSCHTGDAGSNMTKTAGAIPAVDNLRLVQAYLSGDPKATPILPANARFAEPRVASGAAKGNPQLFRLSVDTHGGVFCEGCHGSTHAEWPIGNPNANDNVAAMQLQGHTGKILECETCHTGKMAASLGGPHGMHPVGNTGNTANWVSGHGDFVDRSGTANCRACHGLKGEGSVLAKVAVDRPNLPCGDGGGRLCAGGRVTLKAATQVDCGMCHRNPI